MEFIQRVSADSIYRFFKLHPIEITLISLAFIITVVSAILHFQVNQTPSEVLSAQSPPISPYANQSPPSPQERSATIFVEVSGAVIDPDVYEVEPGTRLKDVIEAAGGLSKNADDLYVARNYNLAKFVGDQEKIYIPYTWDIIDGTFVEQKRILEYLQPLYQTPLSGDGTGQALENQSQNLRISINDASKEELETLSGVGPVTAQKIIESRPYIAIDELLSKKVVNASTLEKIKAHMEL